MISEITLHCISFSCLVYHLALVICRVRVAAIHVLIQYLNIFTPPDYLSSLHPARGCNFEGPFVILCSSSVSSYHPGFFL